MSIKNNTFCWFGIASDVDAGKTFYTNVLGWNLVDTCDGAMFVAPGGGVAHIQPVQDGPPAWCSYLAVEDLDASTAKAGEQGAVLLPPTPLTSGRFSIVAAPSGAVFGLFEPGPTDEAPKPGTGSVHWVELNSTAPESDVAWLASVFGLTPAIQQMASGPYHVLRAGETSVMGVRTSQVGQSFFLPWVEVADVDSTLSAVGEGGGNVVMPAFNAPDVGRMAVVADMAGATFGVVTPNA